MGWLVAQRTHPTPPPVGVTLSPSIVAQTGLSVGMPIARAKAIDRYLRSDVTIGFSDCGFSVITASRGVEVPGSSTAGYVVSQIGASGGNC
jgi:hypothetical protein